MPIYEYRCDNGHDFEAFQSMSEDPFSKCMECGAPAERVLSAPAVHFKGSGFYTTDYARSKKKPGDSGSEPGDSGSGSSDSSSSKDSTSKNSESKGSESKGSDSKSSSSSSSD